MGYIQGIVGSYVGVALDTPDGKNDGSAMGQRYFTCRPLHGIFCKAGKCFPAEHKATSLRSAHGRVKGVQSMPASAVQQSVIGGANGHTSDEESAAELVAVEETSLARVYPFEPKKDLLRKSHRGQLLTERLRASEQDYKALVRRYKQMRENANDAVQQIKEQNISLQQTIARQQVLIMREQHSDLKKLPVEDRMRERCLFYEGQLEDADLMLGEAQKSWRLSAQRLREDKDQLSLTLRLISARAGYDQPKGDKKQERRELLQLLAQTQMQLLDMDENGR